MLIYTNINSNQYNDQSSRINDKSTNSQYDMISSTLITPTTIIENDFTAVDEGTTSQTKTNAKTDYFINTITASHEYESSYSKSESKEEEEIAKTAYFVNDSFTKSNYETTNIKVEFTRNSKFFQYPLDSKTYTNFQMATYEFETKSDEEASRKNEKSSNSYLKGDEFPYSRTSNNKKKEKGSNNRSLIIEIVIGIVIIILLTITVIIIFIKKRRGTDRYNENDQPNCSSGSAKENNSSGIIMRDITSNRHDEEENDLNF